MKKVIKYFNSNKKQLTNKCDNIYKNYSFLQLFNAYSIYKLCQYNILVDNFQNIFNKISYIIPKSILYTLMEKTIGKQFTAGNDFKELENVSDFFNKEGYQILVNYISEYTPEKQSENDFVNFLNKYLESIKFGDKYKNYSIAIKFSCLVEFDILKLLNIRQMKIDKIIFELLRNNEAGNFFINKNQIKKSLENFSNEKIFDKVFNKMEIFYKENNIEFFDKNLVHIPTLRMFFGSIMIDYDSKNELYELYKKFYNEDELEKIHKFIKKIDKIGKEADNNNNFLAIDAEQIYLQASIRNITEQFQLKYNYKKNNKAIFMNTYQNYLKETKEFLSIEIEKCKFLKKPFYLKLVRGAYLYEEKDNNKEMFCESMNETSMNYNTNSLSLLFNCWNESKLMFATHNNGSFEIISKFDEFISNYKKIKEDKFSNLQDSIWNNEGINNYFINNYKNYFDEKQLDKSSYKKIINFATLLGLNDILAYKCLENNYNTIKYLPFGPKEIMLPFLIRRAQETKTLFLDNKEILNMIKSEIKNRIIGKNN